MPLPSDASPLPSVLPPCCCQVCLWSPSAGRRCRHVGLTGYYAVLFMAAGQWCSCPPAWHCQCMPVIAGLLAVSPPARCIPACPQAVPHHQGSRAAQGCQAGGFPAAAVVAGDSWQIKQQQQQLSSSSGCSKREVAARRDQPVSTHSLLPLEQQQRQRQQHAGAADACWQQRRAHSVCDGGHH